jgi:hypothetical protein
MVICQPLASGLGGETQRLPIAPRQQWSFTLSGIADEAKPALVEALKLECEPELVGTNAPV